MVTEITELSKVVSPAPDDGAHAIALPRLAALTATLAIVALVIREFNIQSTVFWWLCALTIGGFAVHALLPFRYRLRFFVALSMAGILLCVGPGPGAMLIGAALALIAICHAPLPFYARALSVIACGVVLAAVNLGWWGWMQWRPMQIVMPVLGSMFMFRMIIYLYDLSHAKKPEQRPTFWQTSAYFLLLPNVCFPLFPVVDYTTAWKTYYNARAEQIYTSGVRWMLTGVLHLLLYRLVVAYVTVAPDAVVTPFDRGRWIVSTYLVYLQVSGQFHLAVGMLQLFGFNLPRTHNRYFLARSFTDVWQRVNVYWTDFMQKLVFYPVSFYLRRRRLSFSATRIAATAAVVIATWALHPYQTFWLRRRFPINAMDALFWGTIGVLMLVTILRDQRKRASRAEAGPPPSTIGRALGAGLGVVVTFCMMSILWSLWSCSTFGDWSTIVFGAR